LTRGPFPSPSPIFAAAISASEAYDDQVYAMAVRKISVGEARGPSPQLVSAPCSGVRMTGRVSARNTGIQLRTQPLAADPRQAAEKDKACAALSVRGKRSTRP